MSTSPLAGLRQPVRVPKTAEVVAQAIRGQIVRGEIAEGEALPSEAALMARFGVSRPSLREAFRVLESERLISVRRGARGGARALKPDVAVAARYLRLLMQMDGVPFTDVFQARALFEPLGLRLVAQRPNRRAAAQELLDVVGELTPAVTDPHLRADIWSRFLQRLFALAGNKTLALMFSTLDEVVWHEIERSMATPSSAQPDRWVRAVQKALDMVAEGRGDDAAAYWMRQMMSLQSDMERRHGDKTLREAGWPG